jgi:hypothetical protein
MEKARTLLPMEERLEISEYTRITLFVEGWF